MTKAIIGSILDNDQYKLTMGQVAFGQHDYRNLIARYAFINRGGTQFPRGFDEALREQVGMMADLRLTEAEAAFIHPQAGNCYYLSPSYVEWFSGFRFDPDQVKIDQYQGELQVTIEGPWYKSIYWEVPLMATISQLYFEMMGIKPSEDYLNRAVKKLQKLLDGGVTFADFGTRRRFSVEVQRNVVKIFALSLSTPQRSGKFVGTSNVMLAHELGLTPIGTYAHEWPMANQAVYGNRMANEKAMEAWSLEFGGYLGTALTDTLTTPVFLRSFGPYYAKLFDGVRQDSGNPYTFADQMINHYRGIRVDPTQKTIVFSDGLDTESAIAITRKCKGRIGCACGIGTHFSNDVGAKPLNIVIKATAFNVPRVGWVDVCKLSDNPGKASGDPRAIELARYELGIMS